MGSKMVKSKRKKFFDGNLYGNRSFGKEKKTVTEMETSKWKNGIQKWELFFEMGTEVSLTHCEKVNKKKTLK